MLFWVWILVRPLIQQVDTHVPWSSTVLLAVDQDSTGIKPLQGCQATNKEVRAMSMAYTHNS